MVWRSSRHSSETVRQTDIETLTFDEIIAFNGSIHAMYPKELWQPYSSLLAEDLLHDAQILLKAGGTACMTSGAYMLTLHSGSLCATTNQGAFNRDYEKISKEAAHPEVRRLFVEKIAMGNEYDEAMQNGMNIGFHQFVMHRQSARQTQGLVSVSRQVG